MIPRRAVLAAGPAALAGCGRSEEGYLGRVEAPTLDPTLSTDLWEGYIISAMFEGLTSLHPATGDPMAGLATHCEGPAEGVRFTFYLRGHPQPRGTRLLNTSDLPREFSRGREAPAPGGPALWSDGTPITAHDLIYSWRRAVDPATGSVYCYLMDCIKNAAFIRAGTRTPDELGMRAVDDFALEVELRTPTPFFLQLVSHRVFCAVPRRGVEAHGALWTAARNIVVSGAFVLREWRPYERIVLTRNPHYYEAANVAMDEISFFPVVDGSTAVNLYRRGDGSVVQALLPQFLPALRRKKDFRIDPNFGTIYPLINTARAPLNDVRVRYALNMAIDKRAVADFAGAGQTAASSLVPRSDGYNPPKTLPVSIDGTGCDVLAFNPQAARELFAKAIGNRRPVRIEFLFPNLPDAKPVAEILQQQWKRTLGIEVILLNQELQIWLQSVYNKGFNGVTLWGDLGGFADPAWFLEQFTASSPANPTGWTDRRYDTMLAEAAATTDIAERMRKLSQCERILLGGMPFLPLYNWVTPYLCKPFVRGFGSNPLDSRQWKYTWIDTNWRAS